MKHSNSNHLYDFYKFIFIVKLAQIESYRVWSIIRILDHSLFNWIFRNRNIEVVVDVVLNLIRNINRIIFFVKVLVKRLRIKFWNKGIILSLGLFPLLASFLRFLRLLLLNKLGLFLVMHLLSLILPLFFKLNSLIPFFF